MGSRRSRSFILPIVGGLLAAGTPPPAPLAQYVRQGLFDPGDYGWARGGFADASATDRMHHDQIRTWLDCCTAAAQTRAGQALKAMGVIEPKLPPGTYDDALCRDVVAARLDNRHWASFAALSADVRIAAPIADTFVWATGLASEIGSAKEPGLTQRLLARPLAEQMLRFGSGWGGGASIGAPALTPGVRAIVLARISVAMGRADHANTQFLKRVMSGQGWPKRSAVGDAAADAAWLMVQHADDDPAFQLRVLRAMEPMLASGEVSRSNYAYLYDRVMLKIAGVQRYATQMTCRAGGRVPQPLEDAGAVDRRRAEAGLPPLAEYQRLMTKLYGDCPA